MGGFNGVVWKSHLHRHCICNEEAFVNNVLGSLLFSMDLILLLEELEVSFLLWPIVWPIVPFHRQLAINTYKTTPQLISGNARDVISELFILFWCKYHWNIKCTCFANVMAIFNYNIMDYLLNIIIFLSSLHHFVSLAKVDPRSRLVCYSPCICLYYQLSTKHIFMFINTF